MRKGEKILKEMMNKIREELLGRYKYTVYQKKNGNVWIKCTDTYIPKHNMWIGPYDVDSAHFFLDCRIERWEEQEPRL